MKSIPNSNCILTFFHCARCIDRKPDFLSPREYANLEVGFTQLGLQVWCNRCECNVVHIDFQGNRHPANVQAKPMKTLRAYWRARWAERSSTVVLLTIYAIGISASLAIGRPMMTVLFIGLFLGAMAQATCNVVAFWMGRKASKVKLTWEL